MHRDGGPTRPMASQPYQPSLLHSLPLSPFLINSTSSDPLLTFPCHGSLSVPPHLDALVHGVSCCMLVTTRMDPSSEIQNLFHYGKDNLH